MLLLLLLAVPHMATASFVPGFTQMLQRCGGQQLSMVSCMGARRIDNSQLLNSVFDTSFPCKGGGVTGLAAELAPKVAVLDTDGLDSRSCRPQDTTMAVALSDAIIYNLLVHDITSGDTSSLKSFRSSLEKVLMMRASGVLRNVRSPKKALVVVVRDYEAQDASKQQVQDVTLKNLDAMWKGMSRPQEYADSQLGDIFDVQFVFLPHPEFADAYAAEIAALKRRFASGEIGQTSAPEIIARVKDIDSSAGEASTEGGEMVAAHRCQQVSLECWKGYLVRKMSALKILEEKPEAIQEFGAACNQLISSTLKDYDDKSRPWSSTSTAGRKRVEVEEMVTEDLHQQFNHLLMKLYKQEFTVFTQRLKAVPDTWESPTKVADLRKEIETHFTDTAKSLIPDAVSWSFSYERSQLNDIMTEVGNEKLTAARLQGQWMPNMQRKPVGISLHWLHPHPFGKDSRTASLGRPTDSVLFNPSRTGSTGRFMTTQITGGKTMDTNSVNIDLAKKAGDMVYKEGMYK